MDTLDLSTLEKMVTGNDAAIRFRVRMQPAGGKGDKIYPSTYEGGEHAWETRRIEGQETSCVLLDSVQAQANRMELALLDAIDNGRVQIPVIAVDFKDKFPDLGEITTLETPHRIADAIHRDSLLDGTPFRESEIGIAFESSNINNATPLYRYCPTALVFGIWDSTGKKGGMGAKFQRLLVSEIVGVAASSGVSVASRIDPVGIRNVEIYEAQDGWTTDPEKALKAGKGKLKTKKPSDVNHSNIPPTMDKLKGGATIDYAELTAVLSFPALRRLRFPLDSAGQSDPKVDAAGRTVIAALAISAICLQHDIGYDLRSRCLVVPESQPVFELLKNNGESLAISLSVEDAISVLSNAVGKAKQLGLNWEEERIKLTPQEKLCTLIEKSRALNETKPE